MKGGACAPAGRLGSCDSWGGGGGGLRFSRNEGVRCIRGRTRENAAQPGSPSLSPSSARTPCPSAAPSAPPPAARCPRPRSPPPPPALPRPGHPFPSESAPPPFTGASRGEAPGFQGSAWERYLTQGNGWKLSFLHLGEQRGARPRGAGSLSVPRENVRRSMRKTGPESACPGLAVPAGTSCLGRLP